RALSAPGKTVLPWIDLLRRPTDFSDGPIAVAWFAALADMLLNRSVLSIHGRAHRLTEVEVYYHSELHPDPFAHRDPVQVHGGRWYFHKSHGSYRGGSFKGLDLTFGDESAHAGVLFRGLQAVDGSYIDGPSLLVDYVLDATGYQSVAELDRSIGTR